MSVFGGGQADADITSTNATSPSIRMHYQCSGGSDTLDPQFTNQKSGVDEIVSCGNVGFIAAQCQVQFVSTDTGSHCGRTCITAH
jgi:hypothetical protein